MNALTAKKLDLYYGDFHALKNVNLSIAPKKITALIGPSGCGKSTLLRVFNRMNELIAGVKITGEVKIFGRTMNKINLLELRKSVGMVFQRPNPFPLTIYDNVI
ncbi:MAG: ATP-binding cassette domain-containing protein, partial [Deltaproteobacteria bacterium]|nr:ATP-binding cassette domain-containing protein [Deltaproteobacteria bacterium]